MFYFSTNTWVVSFTLNGKVVLFHLSENDVPNEKNTIVFKLHVRCQRGGPRLTGNVIGHICLMFNFWSLDKLLIDGHALNYAVKSNELKWLPMGSEFPLAMDNSTLNSSLKPKTYTSFSCSQDSLREFSNNPIAPKHPDIIIDKLGPGQVIFYFCLKFLLVTCLFLLLFIGLKNFFYYNKYLFCGMTWFGKTSLEFSLVSQPILENK